MSEQVTFVKHQYCCYGYLRPCVQWKSEKQSVFNDVNMHTHSTSFLSVLSPSTGRKTPTSTVGDGEAAPRAAHKTDKLRRALALESCYISEQCGTL